MQAVSDVEAGLLAGAADAAGLERQRDRPGEAVDEPLGALVGLRSAQAEAARPAGEALRREQVEPLLRRQPRQRLAEQAAHELFADELQRPGALLPAAAEQGVDELEQKVFQKIHISLIRSRRDEQLPRRLGAVLDGVEQMRLAGPLVAQHRDHFRVHRGGVAVQIDDGEELFALLGEQFGDVVAGADFVVGVAREVVAERVAGAAQRFQGALRQGSNGGGWHGNLAPHGRRLA